jgi:primosomal protein N'
VIQTRVPTHPVLLAALHADPGRLADTEAAARRALQMAPPTALALVSGQAAAAYVEELRARAVEVLGPSPGASGPVFLLRSPSHQELCDALAATVRPSGGLRIDVDPRRA